MFDTPLNTTDQSVDRLLAAGLPVALVFLDGRPSPDLAQAMDRLARQYAGQLLIAKIQVKDSPATTRRFQIGGTPALVTLRKGQEVSRAGAISARDLAAHVEYLLGKGPRPAETGPAAGVSGAGRPVPVSDETFNQEVIRSKRPVLVDFWAPWCAPCRITEPILEKLARELSGQLKIAKVNVDENPNLSQRYGVRSIPTMMIVKDGTIMDRWMGAIPEPAIRNRIAPFIGRS